MYFKVKSNEFLDKLNNNNLKNIFSNHSDYINLEYCLNIESEVIYTNNKYCNIFSDAYLKQNSIAIITPKTYENIEDKNAVRILSSPLECGRVLELGEIVIDEKPYTITVKGVGCTEFARETTGINPWIFGLEPDAETKIRYLQRYPFLRREGFIELDAAINEQKASEVVAGSGLLTTCVVGITKLISLPDPAGILRPITYFREQKYVKENSTPAQIFRIQHSNLRLSDLFMLYNMNYTDSLELLVDHAVNLTEKITKENHDPESYFYHIMGTLIRQQLWLTVRGFSLTGMDKWTVVARNVSIAGEELDLENFSQNEAVFQNTNTFFKHIVNNFSITQIIIMKLSDVINTLKPGSIKCDDFAQRFYSAVMSFVDNDFMSFLGEINPEFFGKEFTPARIKDTLRCTLFYGITDQYNEPDYIDRFKRTTAKLIASESVKPLI